MKGICRNIYKIARNSAGLTQEYAAELLHISTRSLANYESGVTEPTSDIVHAMMDVYKAKWLGYEHLRMSAVGQKCLPKINSTDLARSVLFLQQQFNEIDRVSAYMIEVASSGKIDNYQEKWDEVTERILKMTGAALSVVYNRGNAS